MRILVKEVNWLGDLVISLPALRAVRRAHPQATVAVLVRRELASFFDGFAWVDEVIPYALRRGVAGVADRWRLAASLRARRFDLAVVFPRSFDAALVPFLARVPRRAGWSGDGRLLLTDVAPRRRPAGEHQIHAYLRLVRDTLGIDGDPDDFAVGVSSVHRDTVQSWLASRRHRPDAPLVALAVAAAYGPAKEWPADRYAAVVDRLAERCGAECVLVGAPSERARCEAVAAGSRTGALVAAGEMHLGETIALLSLCAGFAGNDSGPMHVAAALGIPTVGIFGSTDPARTGPLGTRARAVYRRIECSPCFARTCRYGHYDCLRRIDAETVVEVLADLGVCRGGPG